MSPVLRVLVIVSGRVQGVGYRAFACAEGQALGLRGFARNLPDGTVEVHAEGPRSELETLLARLRAGPRSGRVSRLSTSWAEPGSGLPALPPTFDILP